MGSLEQALSEVRELLLSPGLIRAVASGQRRGGTPAVLSATLRPIEVKAGQRWQLVTQDGQRPTTVNLLPGDAAQVDKLLAEPFGSWLVETSHGTVRMQATKKGAVMHRSGQVAPAQPATHDRAKEHLLDPGDPLFDVIGGNAAKRRQVDAFLRQLPSDLPSTLHVVDLGCGNAYLTFAAYRYLSGKGIDVQLTGIDLREDQRARNTEVAQQLGWADRVRFVAASIADAEVDRPDMVLALHACDTATDDALARAVQWGARWILAAPCCHKDVSRQLRQHRASLLTEHGILRERFADVLTDAVRGALLRGEGYEVEVVEFIDSAHTPRNALIRAVQTGRSSTDPELSRLLQEWQVKPALATLLEAQR
jgi:SAM-dependent methyltransferase